MTVIGEVKKTRKGAFYVSIKGMVNGKKFRKIYLNWSGPQDKNDYFLDLQVIKSEGHSIYCEVKNFKTTSEIF